MLKYLQAEFLKAIINTNSQIGFISPLQRLHIHRTNINSNFTRAINATYPLIRKLLGEDYFYAIVQAYIEEYPSYKGNLYDYGKYFNVFIKNYDSLSELIYLDEVVQFEWAAHQMFFAADYPNFNIELLKNISSKNYLQLHFMLHPASRLIKFNFPILKIIDLCNGIIDSHIDLNEGGINLLMLRYNLEIKLIALPLCEFNFLHELQLGRSITDALKSTLLVNKDFKLEDKLLHWIKNKTIVDFYL